MPPDKKEELYIQADFIVNNFSRKEIIKIIKIIIKYHNINIYNIFKIKNNKK